MYAHRVIGLLLGVLAAYSCTPKLSNIGGELEGEPIFIHLCETFVSMKGYSCTMDAIFSPELLLDFCMHYMHDFCVSTHFHRFLLYYLAKIGENGG